MYLNKNVIWKQLRNGSILYNVISDDKLEMNSTSTQIFLGYYVNKFSQEVIASGISNKVKDVPYEVILEDTRECITKLEDSEFISSDEDNIGYVNLLKPVETMDNAMIEITGRCNLNCIHCL